MAKNGPKNIYDVIVLGVGGVGSSACYHLAKSGVKVLGLEQFSLVHSLGSSHGETRIIRKAYFEHSDYVPLLDRAYDLWAELEHESQKKLYNECGILMIGPENGGLVLPGVLKSSHDYKIKTEKLDRTESMKRFPMYFVPENFYSVFEPHAGYLQVEDSVKTHIELAQKHGADILGESKILSITYKNSEYQIKTSQDSYVSKKIIMTSGAWSTKVFNLLKPISVNLNPTRNILLWFQSNSKQSNSSTAAPCFFYELSANQMFYGFPKNQDGLIKVGDHTPGTTCDPDTLNRVVSTNDETEMRQFTTKNLLQSKNEIQKSAACMYTMSQDGHFIIDEHPEYKDCYFLCGTSGHGFKFTSVFGEILKDLALHGQTAHKIDFLKLKRFK